jgi:hypothetical protein
MLISTLPAGSDAGPLAAGALAVLGEELGADDD